VRERERGRVEKSCKILWKKRNQKMGSQVQVNKKSSEKGRDRKKERERKGKTLRRHKMDHLLSSNKETEQ